MRRLLLLVFLLPACSESGEADGAMDGRDGFVESDQGALDPDDGVPPPDPDDGVPARDAATDPDDGVPPPDRGVVEPDCVSTSDFYIEHVWNPVFSTTCAACHVAGGVARDTRLLLSGPADVAADLEVLTVLANETYRETPILLLKPTATHPDGHGGGPVLRVGSQAHRDLTQLAERLTGARDACGQPLDPGVAPPEPPADCEVAPPGPRALRRLSHLEYANTVRDVLGFEFDAAGAFTPDRVVNGFDNNASALSVTGLLADQYRTAAEEIATDVGIDQLVACEPGAACAQEVIVRVGGRLFRRPLTGAEIGQYQAIFELGSPDGFEDALRWVLAGMLQSPHFLYRTELGRRVDDAFELTSYEVAAELSYLFWQTAPDETLRTLAESGQLLDPAVVAEQADRLLADPRSADVMAHFSEQWLHLENLPVVTRDPEVYAALNDELRAAMGEETERFVMRTWREGGSLADLLTADVREMNGALAQHYGVPAPNGWADVDLSGTPYGGVLTHGSVLTTHALPTTSSPIHRGLMVRERLLCQPLPDPPANLDTSPPPVDPALSTRERYGQHASDPACAGCHDLIDPLGFAFEHFDGIGRYREQDGQHPVDATGAVTGLGEPVEVDGLRGLAEALAQTPAVDECYVRQWIRYGFGVDDALPMDCYVATVGRGVDALSDVLPAMVATSHFRRRVGGETEEDVPGADLVPTEPGEVVPPPDVEPPPDVVEPDPDPQVTPGAELVVREASRWGTGYCADAVVTNTTDADLDWAVTHPVEGSINNLWNAERSADEGRVTFRGVQWNGTIGPGQTAEFGWCADL